ncbi:unnamed protein product, partial [marine sediment metagenome]
IEGSVRQAPYDIGADGTLGGNIPPSAAIAANPVSGVVPLVVSFSGTGSVDPDGSIVSYAWQFGDGTNGSGASVIHTYTSAGSYTARLTVTDNDGATGTTTRTITADDPAPESYTLAVYTVGSGSVSLSPAGGVYDDGTVVTLTATPVAGNTFTGWSGALSGSANPAQVTMNGNTSVTATFEAIPPDQYTLTVNTVGAGSVSLSPAGGVYDDGTVVTLTATPVAGNTFTGWSGALSGSANPAQVTMNG